MRKGKNTLKQFRKTLKEWKDLHLKAVELHRGQRNENEEEGWSLF